MRIPETHDAWMSDLDLAVRAGRVGIDQQLFDRYVEAVRRHPDFARLLAFKSVSMLAVETLALMRGFALAARGAILEIGAYAGGGTLALADAARATGAPPVISVDRGGSYMNATHQTPDIEAAWRANLAAHDLAAHARLIVGASHEAVCVAAIRDALGGARVGLICLDADGFVWSHLAQLADCLAPDCLLVIDDYAVQGGFVPKQRRTEQAIADALRISAVEAFGVLPWCTWFGRARPDLARHLPTLAAAEAARRACEDPAGLPPAKGVTSASGFTPKT
jgi:predicted O-methyltransferase YrrM